VHQAVADLRGSGVKVACVVGFHEGTYDLLYKLQYVFLHLLASPTKLTLSSREAKQAILAGADELDIVINYPELIARKYTSIYKELVALRSQAPHPTQLKLILETSQLNRSQIIAGCAMAAAANFDFVKTSTGFNGPGANEENVRLMAACCEKFAEGNGYGRQRMLVKAAGGIRTLEDAVKMLQAGASRLGTSGGVWIAKEAKEKAEAGWSTNGAVHGEGRRPSMQTRLFTDY